MNSFFCIIGIISMMTNKVPASRPKRNNEENFNVLLDLYRMNPLRRSKVFKKFSNGILFNGNQASDAATHFESGESGNDKDAMVKFQLIEDTIHVTRTPLVIHMVSPDYNIANNNNNPENFEKDSLDYINFVNIQRKDYIDDTKAAGKNALKAERRQDGENFRDLESKHDSLLSLNEGNDLRDNFADASVIVMR